MNKLSLKRFGTKLALLTLLALPELADAQFNFDNNGTVLAAFRKTSPFSGSYELVVNLGNITNLLALPVGTTINITNYSSTQLTNAFADTGGFGDLQWSCFGSIAGVGVPGSWPTPFGTFPKDTLWYTLPATNTSSQTQPPPRQNYVQQQGPKNLMLGVGSGATTISHLLNVTNVNNNSVLVREPVSLNPGQILSAFIGSGDFDVNNQPLPEDVENLTPDNFDTAQRDDFYQVVPTFFTDPINNSTTNTYFVGYFILNPNGSMTFTRAAQAAVVPVASFTGGPTNGFAGFTANFTNSSTGTITNYIWNFGDGTGLTNTDGSNVTHAYAAGGDYDVTLTVEGPGGINVQSESSFISVSPLPILIAKSGVVAGQFVLSGTKGPAGVQYRILNTTNITLTVATWKPVATNFFNPDGTFSYTNPPDGNAGFFRLVSP
jgi:PKD repeat protein